MSRSDANYWITHLDLIPHPEGGYYRRVFSSSTVIGTEPTGRDYIGPRHACSSIYYLLPAGQISRLHRLKSDELWHFYTGDPLTVHVIDTEGDYRTIRLGPDAAGGEVFQAVVGAGAWFGATVENGYALVGCVVAPAFDFADFELAERTALLVQFPQHRSIIERLTREEG